MSDVEDPAPHVEAVRPALLDDAALDVPNCINCLHPMDAASSPQGGVFWRCTNCGQTRIA